MKKRLAILIAACVIAVGSRAQYAEPIQFPVADLYDSGVMNMYARALAETVARREEIFHGYQELALQAFEDERWYKVIEYANNALNTHYESGLIYYLRGVAHESLENWRQAKKDFKKSIKYGCDPARAALNLLNEKMKNRKRNR